MQLLAWTIIGALLGLAVGSAIATLVIRWPAGRTMGGRSACDHCATPLRAVDLVPLVSFAVNRGGGWSCLNPIDRLHPAIELAAAAVGASALLVLPGIAGLSLAAGGLLLLTLAALDAETLWLPDRLVLPLALLGIADAALFHPEQLEVRLIGMVAGFVLLESVRRLYRRLRGREGMGGGDPKLFGALGAWLGWPALPAVLILAGGAGLAWVLVRRLRGRDVPVELPLGSLMALGAWPLMLLGAAEIGIGRS